MALVTPQASAQFAAAVGVVVHIGPDQSVEMIRDSMAMLGMSRIRTGTPPDDWISAYKELAETAKFVLFECNVYYPGGKVDSKADVALAKALLDQAPGSVIAIEASNEPDVNHWQCQGQDSYENYQWCVLNLQELEKAMVAEPSTRDLQRLICPVKMPDQQVEHGDEATAANQHCYNPNPGGQVKHYLWAGRDYAEQACPGKPWYITETGMSSCGYVNGGYANGTETTQAIVCVNALLEGFKAEAVITFLYELFDWYGAGGAVENAFGLFTIEGRPKQAAEAIGNLMAVLSDVEGDAPLRPLGYWIEGLPSTASQFLLQKGNGDYSIVLWNGEAEVSNGREDLEVRPVAVDVKFDKAQKEVRVYKAAEDSSPCAEGENVRTATIQLGAWPIVVEVPFGGDAPEPEPEPEPEPDGSCAKFSPYA
jgi:hypothetical protein